MAVPPYLLTDQSPPSPDPLAEIRARANCYAEAGQVYEAMETLRKSLSYEVDDKCESHEEALSDLVAHMTSSNGRAVALYQEETRKLVRRALQANSKRDAAMINVLTEELIVEMAKLFDRVFDLGVIQKLVWDSQTHGLDDKDLVWAEKRYAFTAGAE